MKNLLVVFFIFIGICSLIMTLEIAMMQRASAQICRTHCDNHGHCTTVCV